MQDKVQATIANRLKNNLRKQIEYERFELERVSRFEVGPVRTEKVPKIDYIIVVQATSDVPTATYPLFGTFFNQLDDAFDRENLSYKDEKKIQEIIKYYLKVSSDPKFQSLPSIRLPGTATFFRAIDIGDMEIVTWTRLQAMRLEKKLAGLHAKKLGAVMPESSEIELPIKQGTKYVQIFPCNLMDCTLGL